MNGLIEQDIVKARFNFPQSFGVKTDRRDQHPMATLSDLESREVERKLRSMAIGMWRQYRLDANELYQEGVLGILERHKRGQRGVGYMVTHARWAMKAYAQKELKQQHTKRDFADVYGQLRTTSRTFDDLEQSLAKLGKRERVVMELWLDGKNLTEIMRSVGMWKTNKVKQVIEQCAGKMAQSLGHSVRVECLWPKIAGSLPVGISWAYGKFVVRVFTQNKQHYVGTFETADEAVGARQKWMRHSGKKRADAE